MNKVAKIVTDKIIEALEAGHIPWIKPWGTKDAFNAVSGKAYRGINAVLLGCDDEGPSFMTMNQANKLKGKVVKGTKSRLVTFYKTVKAKRNSDGEVEKKGWGMLRYYTVFPVSSIEGLPDKYYEANTVAVEDREGLPNELADEIVVGSGADIKHGAGGACFIPSQDLIKMPARESFINDDEYYSTILHELVHWTGHKSRLDRLKAAGFGTSPYAAEELIAEVGAAMLCHHCGIESIIENSAAYCLHWSQKLKDDETGLIMTAASKAQKAYDLLVPERVEVAA